MKTVEDKIKEIRTHLRLAMNGVTSTSMREKGITYKLNFGVPYPEIKEIALLYQKDAALAAALWKEDIREFKILATMLQPVETFTMENANQWVREIPYLEIAEACGKNLFSKLSFAQDLAFGLVFDTEIVYARTQAFLIWGELYKEGKKTSPPITAAFLLESIRSVAWLMFNAPLMERQAAISAMKFYGRQSELQSRQILENLQAFPDYENRHDLKEIYNELKFEFDYYR